MAACIPRHISGAQTKQQILKGILESARNDEESEIAVLKLHKEHFSLFPLSLLVRAETYWHDISPQIFQLLCRNRASNEYEDELKSRILHSNDRIIA